MESVLDSIIQNSKPETSIKFQKIAADIRKFSKPFKQQ